MTSEPIRMESHYPQGHRNRHIPRLCPACTYPLTSRGRCSRCAAAPVPPVRERPVLSFPDPQVRLERMERAAVR